MPGNNCFFLLAVCGVLLGKVPGGRQGRSNNCECNLKMLPSEQRTEVLKKGTARDEGGNNLDAVKGGMLVVEFFFFNKKGNI